MSLGTIQAAWVEANQLGLVSLPSLRYAWCIVPRTESCQDLFIAIRARTVQRMFLNLC